MDLDRVAKSYIDRFNDLKAELVLIAARRKAIAEEMRRLADDLYRLDAFDDALGLAVQERTGEEPPPGGQFRAEDFDRAAEIFRTCWPESDKGE